VELGEPSPKLQFHAVIGSLLDELSVNLTLNGAKPLLTFEVKAAVTGGHVVTVIVLVEDARLPQEL